MTTPAEATARVQLGAAFLDEHDPGWWRLDPPTGEPINLDTLALDSDCECVLGQRCPLNIRSISWSPYVAYASNLWPDTAIGGGFRAVAAEHGLTLSAEDADRDGWDGESWDERGAKWDELTTAWRDLIKIRREEKP